MDSKTKPKGRPAPNAPNKATSATKSTQRNKSKATHRTAVTPAKTAGKTDQNPPPVDPAPKPITKTIPRKQPPKAALEKSEDSDDEDPDDEDEENEEEEDLNPPSSPEGSEPDSPPPSSQDTKIDLFYGTRPRASLQDLFDTVSVTPTSTPTETTTTPASYQKTFKATSCSAPTAPRTSSNAAASATVKAKAYQKTVGSPPGNPYDLSPSQERDISSHLDEFEERQAAKQKERATKLGSLSKLLKRKTTTGGTTTTANSKPAPPYSPAKKVPGTAKAQKATAPATTTVNLVDSPNVNATTATTKAPTPQHNEGSIDSYERQLKKQEKIARKANNAVDTETFIQATITAFATHTNSTLITEAIAELTRALHVLTQKVHDYQAKATKFRDLPEWIPRSCRSGFAICTPKDIPDDDPGLLQIREDAAGIRNTYETALRAAVKRKELLLLTKALHERRDAFITRSLDIATNWLSLWLPKNAKLLRRTPLTMSEEQVVGLIFERLLHFGDGHDLRMDLDNFFNQGLKLPHMLAANLRAQPRFKNKEDPEKRIFRNREDADAETMYAFTKVTWAPNEFGRLEAAIRVIEKPLTAFLSLLCTETTFRFQEEYDAELEYKLAELKVEARLKKQATMTAAAATAKALAEAHKAMPESIQKTVDKLDRKVTQVQRTQQRHGERNNKPPSRQANTNHKPNPKNSTGGRGKGPSVAPRASNKGNNKDEQHNPRHNNSRQRQPKRKQTQEKNPQQAPQQLAGKRAKQNGKRPNNRHPKKTQPATESPDESNNAVAKTNDSKS
jgi:hypothetical protein